MWTALHAFTVYLEDLRDLLDVVREVATAVDIETEDATEIGGLDELAAERLGRRVRWLTVTGIKAGKPQAIIRLEPTTATVWVASDSATHLGVITKAQRVMWRHTSKLAPADLWPFELVIGLSLAAVSLGGGAPYLAAVWLILVAVVLALARVEHGNYARIVLLPRSQAPGFLARQRENIAVTLVVGILSGVAVLVIGWLAQSAK